MEIRTGSKNYNVYAVVIRGTFDSIEWVLDFDVGTGINHLDFYACMLDIRIKLNELIKEDGGENVHVWITGHSRGAAIGNLLAAKCCNDPAISKVYAYLYATPAVSTSVDASLPIYNYIDRADLIPMLPMREWGYGRNGTDISFGSRNYVVESIPSYVRQIVNDDKSLFAGAYTVLYDHIKDFLRTSPELSLKEVLIYIIAVLGVDELYDAYCLWYYANGYTPITAGPKVKELINNILIVYEMANDNFDAIWDHHVQTSYASAVHDMY